MEANIVLLPGDGIGPEVLNSARQVMEHLQHKFGHSFSFSEHKIGGSSIEAYGTALSQEALIACKSADAVLLGAVGGPKWDDPRAAVRPEQGLLALRQGMGVYANLRPVKIYPSLLEASPLKPEKLTGVDLLVVRELTGGLYFGKPKGRQLEDGVESAVDTLIYHDYEIERVLLMAFDLARRRNNKVTSVDKANVLESSRLWRQIAIELGRHNPDIALEHVLVDTAAMRLVAAPASFDVIVTENMFGDILTDEAAVLSGSMGLLPSASLGKSGAGLYEPIHGSAPDIAGKGIANPIGTVLSTAMLLRYSLKLENEAVLVEKAVEEVIASGLLTPDLGGTARTDDVTRAIIERL